MARESRYKNIEELQKKRTSLVAELKERNCQLLWIEV